MRAMGSWAAGIAALLLAMAAGQALAGVFDYARATPNVVYGVAESPAPGVTARDVSFISPSGRTVTGELILGGDGKRPGVLFVHWLGAPKTTNHTEFEADAIALAQKGATSLLIDTMWSNPAWIRDVGKDAETDLRGSVDQVIDLRASLDLLVKQPGVDKRRIVYVGHDFGAMFGAVVARVDKRPRYYVFLAGNDSMTAWYRFRKPNPDAEAYAAKLTPLDPVANLKAARPKAVLLQFSSKDTYIPEANAKAVIAATPEPKQVLFYEADHSLDVPKAAADRQAWLIEHLF